MEMPNIVCYALLEEMGRETKHFWIYELKWVPKIGARINGREFGEGEEGRTWKVRLVIRDPNLVAMVAAFWAVDRVSDQGSGFVENFRDLLADVVSGKRVV